MGLQPNVLIATGPQDTVTQGPAARGLGWLSLCWERDSDVTHFASEYPQERLWAAPIAESVPMAVVIIVEDDDAWRTALEAELRRRGHSPIGFGDYTGVLELLETSLGVDAMLCDLRLPPGTPNGLSLALMARRRRPGLKIVLMTAMTDLPHDLANDFGALVPKTADMQGVIAAAGLVEA